VDLGRRALFYRYEDIYTAQSKEFFMRGCDMTVSHGTYGTTK
jgi:hypothetical protein